MFNSKTVDVITTTQQPSPLFTTTAGFDAILDEKK